MIDLGTALNIALAADGEMMSVLESGDRLRPIEDASWASSLWSAVRNAARELDIKV